MRVTFLGSGSAMPTGERFQTGILVQEDGRTLLVDCGSGVLHRLQQSFLFHPPDRAVQGGGPQADFPSGALGNLLHHGISVPIAVGKCEKDVKPVGFQRDEPVQRWLRHDRRYSCVLLKIYML